MWFGYLTLAVAFFLSAVAAYYSVLGLVAIFSAAAIPVIIMGGALETGKVVAAMWLHRNWDRALWTYKAFLLPSLLALMLLTSMGTFGFLSKAHSDQSLVSGDVTSKIALYDEKIRVARENIDANRAALKQLDAGVDQTLLRSTTESGAERSVQIRRQQAPERTRLLRDIETEQKKIAQLNEERAPIAAEVRKVEAEVGPIKYIAALIYGDNLENNLLESAVRWVIILIVIVFDPLSIVLILAGTRHLEWERALRELKPNLETTTTTTSSTTTTTTSTTTQSPPLQTYLTKPWRDHVPGVRFPPQVETTTTQMPMVAGSDPDLVVEKLLETDGNLTETQIERVVNNSADSVVTQPVVEERPKFKLVGTDYVVIADKMMHRTVAFTQYPWLQDEIQRIQQVSIPISANDRPNTDATFGNSFPTGPKVGHMHVHTGSLPTKLYRYNGERWLQVDKSIADSYTHNYAYIKMLVDRMNKNEISIDDLNVAEKNLVNHYFKTQNG